MADEIRQGRKGPQGARGEPGPPGQLPSIEQVMPWLHLVFDAYKDYKRLCEREPRPIPNRCAATSVSREAAGILQPDREGR